jgi:2'-hydroxyisoflavone reductase
LANGYTVTLLNRGITDPNLFRQLELIKCDRYKGVASIPELHYRKWDAVIDVWPQDPRLVEDAASFFKPRTRHYVFISSIAAYQDYKKMGIDETYPTRPGTDFIEGDYSTNKAVSERVIQKYFPQQFSILRPCAIIGDRDTSYSFRFWTWNIKRGDEILAPGGKNETAQFVEVDDVGRWVYECIEKNYYGFFNTVGPEDYLTFHDFIERSKSIVNPAAKVVYVSDEFLTANGINTSQATPLWHSYNSEQPGLRHISNRKVRSMGMKFKSVSESIKDSLKSYNDTYQFGDRDNWAGLSRSEERELIAKWKTSQ